MRYVVSVCVFALTVFYMSACVSEDEACMSKSGEINLCETGALFANAMSKILPISISEDTTMLTVSSETNAVTAEFQLSVTREEILSKLKKTSDLEADYKILIATTPDKWFCKRDSAIRQFIEDGGKVQYKFYLKGHEPYFEVSKLSCVF